jgi:hypothetical protein
MERGTRNAPVENEPQFFGLCFDAALFADLARQTGALIKAVTSAPAPARAWRTNEGVMAMGSSKARSRIDLAQAVERMDKARKREPGTPPKPYRPPRDAKKRPPSVGKRDLAATKRLRGKSTLH